MKGRDSTVIEERFMIAETLASMQAHRSISSAIGD
jgi:hypothetical protein